MNNWKKIKLSEVTSKIGDGLHGTPIYTKDGDYFFINGRNLLGRIILDNDTKRVNLSEYEKYKKDLNNRTLLVSINGTLGNIAEYNNEKIILGKSACYLNILEHVNKDYIKYILINNNFQSYLNMVATGTTIKNVSLRQMRDYEFKLPNSEIQQKIVNILKPLDDKIILNTQTNQTLEQIAQAIFKHWFIDFAPVHAKANALARGETIEQAELAAMACLSGKTVDKITALKAQDPTAYHQLQQTAAAFPSEFVETEMGQVPRGWERTTLTHICEMKNGYAFKSKEWTDEGIPVIKIGSVKPMLIELDNGSFVAAENETLRADFLASEGDILVGLTGYVGEVGRIPYQEKAMINQRVAKFMPKKITETMNYYCFIYCLARQKEFKAFTEMNAKGSAQANISTKEILSYPVIIATKEIHIAFENTVKNLLDKIIVNSGENSTLAKTRDELLPRLLSGEIEL